MNIHNADASFSTETPGFQAPLPLCPPVQDSLPYPVHSLGKILGEAADAIAEKCQCAPSMAGQSVLAVASLAAMSLFDVMLPYGQKRPLALAFVTIAASGDRKSTVDNEALRPVRERERELKIDYDRDFEAWRISFAAWQSQHRKIEADRNLDRAGQELALGLLGRAPLEPIRPFLVAPEPTIEGLTKHWHALPGGIGLFSAEGGQMTGGSGMGQDHKLKTAAALSALWGGEPLRRFRAGDGISDLPGRRLAIHLMVQPDVASAFLSDPVLRDQGLLSRMLVAAPESLAGLRMWQERDSGPDDAMRRYTKAILGLLETPALAANLAGNELTPRELRFSADARAAWIAFADNVEVMQADGGALENLRDVGAKVAENAGRIAGVLQIIEAPDATQIELPVLESACQLASWYLDEALRLSGQRLIPAATRDAMKLHDWLAKRGAASFVLRDVLRLGPNSLRTKAAAEAAIARLVDHGWLTRQGDGRGASFTLIREARQ